MDQKESVYKKVLVSNQILGVDSLKQYLEEIGGKWLVVQNQNQEIAFNLMHVYHIEYETDNEPYTVRIWLFVPGHQTPIKVEILEDDILQQIKEDPASLERKIREHISGHSHTLILKGRVINLSEDQLQELQQVKGGLFGLTEEEVMQIFDEIHEEFEAYRKACEETQIWNRPRSSPKQVQKRAEKFLQNIHRIGS